MLPSASAALDIDIATMSHWIEVLHEQSLLQRRSHGKNDIRSTGPPIQAVTTLYPLERSDAFLLTGQGFNRGTHPIAFYALTIAPVTG